MWTPLVRELALRGHRALPVELPGHGFDAVFPAGYQCPQDTEKLATAPSPAAGLTLDDYVAHTLQIVRKVAVHSPVVLIGHSMGGSIVTRVANTAPELLARIVYLGAYCCVAFPSVPAYAPTPRDADSVLAHAREVDWIGDPARTGASRTNPRAADPQVLAAQHALLMADLDPVLVPAVLNYALQPDESLQAILADAQVWRPRHLGPATSSLHPHHTGSRSASGGAGPHDRRSRRSCSHQPLRRAQPQHQPPRSAHPARRDHRHPYRQRRRSRTVTPHSYIDPPSTAARTRELSRRPLSGGQAMMSAPVRSFVGDLRYVGDTAPKANAAVPVQFGGLVTLDPQLVRSHGHPSGASLAFRAEPGADRLKVLGKWRFDGSWMRARLVSASGLRAAEMMSSSPVLAGPPVDDETEFRLRRVVLHECGICPVPQTLQSVSYCRAPVR